MASLDERPGRWPWQIRGPPDDQTPTLAKSVGVA
jgi:hypothetical protein